MSPEMWVGKMVATNHYLYRPLPAKGRSERGIFAVVLCLAVCASGRAATRVNHAKLLTYVDEQGHEKPIANEQDWAQRRKQILEGMQEAMGTLPDRSRLPPLNASITDEVRAKDITRRAISFDLAPGKHRIPAYLLIPTSTRIGQRFPAMLALHQTTAVGKAEVAGMGKPNMAYGLELARRGYVVLCPDYPSFGDYPCDFKDPNFASGTLLGVFGHMRCVDLLESLPEVDPQRIGVIGHSLGGHNAMFLAVFDPRVKVVVSSCGWTPFADYRGGNLAGWSSSRYMPRIKTAYRLNPDALPFDFYEVVAAIAPRPFFSNSPTHDQNFDVRGVKKAEAESRKVYSLLHASNLLQVRYPDSTHDFPDEVRIQAYAFIDSVLKP